MNTIQPIRLIHLATGNDLPLSRAPRCTLALGNFDGVHTAHRMLLSSAVRLADEIRNCHSAVFFFDPPTSVVLSSGTQGLSTLQEKLDAFYECGIEYAFLANFSALKDMPADQFIRDVLLQVCHAQKLVCGFHFRFGRGGRGDVTKLREHMGVEHVCVIPPCCMPVHGQDVCHVISSTAIRRALSNGDVRLARLLLGTPYSLSAKVEKGKQLGRKMGIPTINQMPPSGKAMPANGVYVTRALVDGTWIYGISNIGVHPTVDDDAAMNCETHLFDFNGNLYDKVVTVEFLEQLRPEIKFSSLPELQQAIRSDIQRAKQMINTL